MPNKESLTMHEIELIAKSLGEESWHKFILMTKKRRLKFGKEIVKRFNKGGAVFALLKVIRKKRAEFNLDIKTNKGE
jgi:hypothetical protein